MYKDLKIILASNSKIRKKILENAGIEVYKIIDSNVDEKKIKEENKNFNGERLSKILAHEKAKIVSKNNKESIVIAADQVLSCENIIFNKSKNIKEMTEKLNFLKNKKHYLHCSFSIFKNEKKLYEKTFNSEMYMKNFSVEWLDMYVEREKNKVLSSVGCYHFEGFGVNLFKKVKGDYFSILGIPLLEVLNFLENYKK